MRPQVSNIRKGNAYLLISPLKTCRQITNQIIIFLISLEDVRSNWFYNEKELEDGVLFLHQRCILLLLGKYI